MLRLTILFCLCMVSAANALEEGVVEATDREMRIAFQTLLSDVDDESRRVLEKSQLTWAHFRTASCVLYRDDDHAVCLAEMAEARTEQLRAISQAIAAPDCKE
jgi:uncharacterized protein YecT (DUF1311 family)